MNRLQKKCLIAAAGTHFLLVVVLLCSGFIKSKPKPEENTQVLDVIPATAVDKAMQSAVRNAQPPPPTPPTPPEPPQPPTPTPPAPEVKRVEPPTPVEHVKPPEPTVREVPNPDEPAPIKPKPLKHVIEVDVTQKVTRNAPKTPDNSAAEAAEAAKAEKEAKKQRDKQIRVMKLAATSIRDKTSSSTEVNLKGTSSVAYANYGVIVVSAYHHAWVAPDMMTSDSAVVSFSVTISRDGSVTSSHIVAPSGDPNVDRAVQRMLDRVTYIHEFPVDSTDRERTYHIDFNATKINNQ